jgi:hypothetical protein
VEAKVSKAAALNDIAVKSITRNWRIKGQEWQ